METNRMTITYVPLESLTFADYNPRTLSQAKFEDLQRSIDELSILEPAVVNKRDGKLIIVGGNQRVRAAKELGWSEYPCHVIEVPLAREKVINARLNRSSGEDDTEALAEILLNLDEVDRELSGWNDDEILKLQSDPFDDEADVEKVEKPKTYTKETLMDFAGNYPNSIIAKQFIEWLP